MNANKTTVERSDTYVSYVGPKPEIEFIETPELQLVREIIAQNSRILEQNQRILDFLTTSVQLPLPFVETKK